MYAEQHNIMFNVSKTVCMKFDSYKNNVCDFDIYLKSQQLAWVESFDYLGFRLCMYVLKAGLQMCFYTHLQTLRGGSNNNRPIAEMPVYTVWYSIRQILFHYCLTLRIRPVARNTLS